MSAPRYIAVRVGDQYELRRVDPDHVLKQGLLTLAGAFLTVLGLSRRTVGGLGLGMIGGGIIYYGLTGRNPLRDFQSSGTRCPERGPSHQNDAHLPSAQCPKDPLEEAAMESFPASDPPALGTKAASGGE